MRKLILILMAVMAISWGVSAEALIEGREYAFNTDGAYSLTSVGPGTPGVVPGGFAQITLSTPGLHYAGFYSDWDIDSELNTYFNEYGAANGAPAAGLSWEIDEPEYLFGDIKTNLKNGALDNANGVPASAPDDVSMALAWNFSLNAGETGIARFFLGAAAPTSGFFLSHTDPNSAETYYFWSTLEISGGGEVPVPEPSTLLVVGSAFGWFALLRKRMKR